MVDETLHAHDFYIFVTGYLKGKIPYFTDITDKNLFAKLQISNHNQEVMHFGKEYIKKKNKYIIKKNAV